MKKSAGNQSSQALKLTIEANKARAAESNRARLAAKQKTVAEARLEAKQKKAAAERAAEAKQRAEAKQSRESSRNQLRSDSQSGKRSERVPSEPVNPDRQTRSENTNSSDSERYEDSRLSPTDAVTSSFRQNNQEVNQGQGGEHNNPGSASEAASQSRREGAEGNSATSTGGQNEAATDGSDAAIFRDNPQRAQQEERETQTPSDSAEQNSTETLREGTENGSETQDSTETSERIGFLSRPENAISRSLTIDGHIVKGAVWENDSGGQVFQIEVSDSEGERKFGVEREYTNIENIPEHYGSPETGYFPLRALAIELFAPGNGNPELATRDDETLMGGQDSNPPSNDSTLAANSPLAQARRPPTQADVPRSLTRSESFAINIVYTRDYDEFRRQVASNPEISWRMISRSNPEHKERVIDRSPDLRQIHEGLTMAGVTEGSTQVIDGYIFRDEQRYVQSIRFALTPVQFPPDTVEVNLGEVREEQGEQLMVRFSTFAERSIARRVVFQDPMAPILASNLSIYINNMVRLSRGQPTMLPADVADDPSLFGRLGLPQLSPNEAKRQAEQDWNSITANSPMAFSDQELINYYKEWSTAILRKHGSVTDPGVINAWSRHLNGYRDY